MSYNTAIHSVSWEHGMSKPKEASSPLCPALAFFTRAMRHVVSPPLSCLSPSPPIPFAPSNSKFLLCFRCGDIYQSYSYLSPLKISSKEVVWRGLPCFDVAIYSILDFANALTVLCSQS